VGYKHLQKVISCILTKSISFHIVHLPSDVFIDHVNRKLQEILLDIEHVVVTKIYKNAEKTLQNVITQISVDLASKSGAGGKLGTLDFFNNTKIWMKNSQTLTDDYFSIKKMYNWIGDSNYTVPKATSREMLEIHGIYDQVKKILKNEKAPKNEPLVIKYKYVFINTMNADDDEEFLFENNHTVFKGRMTNMFCDFKENVTTIIIQKLVQYEIGTVDNIIAELDLHLIAGFRENQAGAKNKALPDRRTIQPYRRLNRLQDTEQSYNTFLKSVKVYFDIHYIEMPAKQWGELQTVKKVFDNVQHQMADQIRRPINSTFRWGREFIVTKQFLLESTSSAGLIPSFINDAVKWCTDKTKNVWKVFAKSGHSGNVMKSLESDTYFASSSNHYQQFDLNSAIVLLDFILRQSKYVKPHQPQNSECINVLEAQGLALNIVNECEQVLLERTGDGDHSFGWLSLQRYLFTSIRNLDDIQDAEILRNEALEIVDNFYQNSKLVLLLPYDYCTF
jgi:hypothetical protein